MKHKYDEKIKLMTREQTKLYTEIIDDIIEEVPSAYFINASAGTGKTFLFNALLETCRAWNHLILPVATSGIAVLIFDGGKTVNSRF